MKAPPPLPELAGGFVCEVRPSAVGAGFQLVSRARVLGWERSGEYTLPVTMAGLVPLAAFKANKASPTDGFAFVLASSPGERRWWTPVAPHRLIADEALKRIMVGLRERAAEEAQRAPTDAGRDFVGRIITR